MATTRERKKGAHVSNDAGGPVTVPGSRGSFHKTNMADADDRI